jgi:lipoate-protein ligase B
MGEFLVQNREIVKIELGDHTAAMEHMARWHAHVCRGGNEVVLVTQHFPVITMGNRFLEQDMLVNEQELASHGVSFSRTDRGGSVTVHEPGQAVVYPIVRVESSRFSVRHFVWILEEAMIRVAALYGVKAARDSINAGIWVGKNKLGAVGIRISQRVSKHGLAFNVNNSLATFEHIVPCGLRERGVTSLEREILLLGKSAEKVSLNAFAVGAQIAREIIAIIEKDDIASGWGVKTEEG